MTTKELIEASDRYRNMQEFSHICVGIYGNGKFQIYVIPPEHLGYHILQTKKQYPNRALFVDNECFHNGYLDNKQLIKWEKIISRMAFDGYYPSQSVL